MDDPTPAIQQPVGASAEGQLPPGAPYWLPILALWPKVTEATHVAITGAFTDEAATPWPEFGSWLVGTGLADAEPDSRPAALLVRPHWLAVLSSALDELSQERDFRENLLDSVHGQQPHLMMKLAGWARSTGRWDLLGEIWVNYSWHAEDVPADVLGIFADLPTEARREHPTLSWACAVAEADAAPRGKAAAFLDRLILDAATLHHDWSLRDDTDSAVIAGILRMIGERYLPPSLTPLDAAWRTKNEIDTFIDERSRKGQAPGRRAHSLFRVMSARLALWRADLRGAVAEAHWGGVLAEDRTATDLAAAIEALAHSLAGEVRGSRPGEPDGPPLDSFRFGSLGQMAAVMAVLARGRQSLQLLDRAGVETSLAAITQEMAGVTGVSASLIGLKAMHAAIWGDARLGLSEMMSALANQPMGAREQDEPLGGVMLGRARSLLLCQIGAFAAASVSVDSVVEGFRSVPEARTLLWAGQLVQAVRAMELTLPDPNLIHADRLQLLIIRGAATSLDNSITPDIETDTVNALRTLVQPRNYLPLAMLPRHARDAIIAICESLSTDPDVHEQFAELKKRLKAVNGGDGTFGLLQLTDREAILLPLLATGDSVPEIARKLHVSVHTVRNQAATLREKFQASTRAELVRKAGDYGALK
ncbi:MAG: helix-turn-helix transcriptional regulator [Propionibacteriaceae bacterium]|nr:helix-turn-helix transcriptional regulator [Propionibacteriaceae bacterium]